MLEAVRPKGHNTAGWILSQKNFSDTIGNRTRDLSDCSAILQPTAPSHALYFISIHRKVKWWEVRICWGPQCWCEYLLDRRDYHACAWLMRRRMCACLFKSALHKVATNLTCISLFSWTLLYLKTTSIIFDDPVFKFSVSTINSNYV